MTTAARRCNERNQRKATVPGGELLDIEAELRDTLARPRVHWKNHPEVVR